MSTFLETALAGATLLPGGDHQELAVSPTLLTPSLSAELPAELQGVGLLWRRVSDLDDSEITGTTRDTILRLQRSEEGELELGQFSYDGVLFSARSQPRMGDRWELGLLAGSWDETWVWTQEQRQVHAFLPITATFLGFARGAEEESVVRHQLAAGTGLGGQILQQLRGPIGVLARAETRWRWLSRAQGDSSRMIRHEFLSQAELGLSWTSGRQVWSLGAWWESDNFWEPRSEQPFGDEESLLRSAGIRLSKRFYPQREPDLQGELAMLDELLALQAEEEGDSQSLLQGLPSLAELSPVGGEEADGLGQPPTETDPAEAAVQPSAVTVEASSDHPAEGMEVHWSELRVLQAADMRWPLALPEGWRCTLRVEVDDDGQPWRVLPHACPEGMVESASELLLDQRYEPILVQGEPQAIWFFKTLQVTDELDRRSP